MLAAWQLLVAVPVAGAAFRTPCKRGRLPDISRWGTGPWDGDRLLAGVSRRPLRSLPASRRSEEGQQRTCKQGNMSGMAFIWVCAIHLITMLHVCPNPCAAWPLPPAPLLLARWCKTKAQEGDKGKNRGIKTIESTSHQANQRQPHAQSIKSRPCTYALVHVTPVSSVSLPSAARSSRVNAGRGGGLLPHVWLPGRGGMCGLKDRSRLRRRR